MRFSVIAVFASLSAVGLSQDLISSLPKCAQTCFGNDLGGCQSSDFKCVCGNTQLIADISCCVSKGCSEEEQTAVIGLASGLCKANGIDVPTSASCAATASGSPSGTASGSPSSSGGAASGTPAPQSTGAAAPFPTAGCGLGMGVVMAGIFAAI